MAWGGAGESGGNRLMSGSRAAVIGLLFMALLVGAAIYISGMSSGGDPASEAGSGSRPAVKEMDTSDEERFPFILEEFDRRSRRFIEVTDGPSRFPSREICLETGRRWREKLMKRGILPPQTRCRDLRKGRPD